MSNLIIKWKEFATVNYGSYSEGIRKMNNVCGTKITLSCVNQMAKGEQAVPASANRFMLLDVVPSEFKKAKFKMSDLDFGKFLNSISIPERTNK